MSIQINYLDEAERFIASRPRTPQSVLVPFIPAIELMLANHLTYREIFEFVNLHGAACTYQTVVRFTKRYVGVVTPSRKQLGIVSTRVGPAGKQSEKHPGSGPKKPIHTIGRGQARQEQMEIPSHEPSNLLQKLARSRETVERHVGKSARELIEQAEKL